MNFVAIDFETAQGYQICAVGIVTVVAGIITDEYYSLIKPLNNQYNWHNTRIHGIKSEDTLNSPSFIQVYSEIRKRLMNKTIVAHNESFDRGVLQKSMRDCGLDYSDLNIADVWKCTLKIYRKKEFNPADLNSCCQKLGISLIHHEALSDARGCAKLYLKR